VTTERIGFVGLGHMGLPMARRLAEAGYQVAGFDASAKVLASLGGSDGISAAPTLASVADAGTVILMLPDSDVVEQVLLGSADLEGASPEGASPEAGLLAGLEPGSMIIDMSSSDPSRTRELAGRAGGLGITLIDAPVSGGVAGAVAGSLTIMVGGPQEAFSAIRPVLETMGSRVVRAGDVGAGHAVKALNNLMSAAHLLASSEALIAGRRFGLDPAVMLEIINGSSGRSGSTELKWPRYVLTETYNAGFPVRLMVKDIKLALAIERATGTPSAVSAATVAAWSEALEDLPPDADHTAIARWLDQLPAVSSGDG
jgi:3-hydroxyisobutyrate dehydrogenase